MSFKFISGDSVGFTAGDEATLDEITISGVFIEQTKRVGFRIGNTGSELASYQITTSGINSAINDDVQYSADGGLTFADAVQVSGVQPNMISDLVFVEYTPQDGDVIGVGSFLIKVNEQ